MPLPKWKIENDLCRCCHSEGSYVNLAGPRIVGGEIEVYSEMLLECFNIVLSPVQGELNEVTYSICENCANKVRDALNFKHQVLECEKKFETMYRQNCIVVSDLLQNVKIEIDICTDDEEQVNVDVKQNDPTVDENDDGLEDSGNDFFFPEGLDSNTEDEGIEKHKTPNQEPTISKKQPKISKKPTKSTRLKKIAEPQTGKSKTKQTKKNESISEREDKKKGDADTAKRLVPTGPKFYLREYDFTHEEDGLMKCAKCSRKYNNIGSLRYHVKTNHYKVPKHICPYCLKEFMTVAPFIAHKFEEHNVDERYHCNACKGIFNTKAQLKKHTNSFHMMGVKYKCDMCDYESFSCESLYKHKFKHNTVKNFHCKFCKKSFLRRATLVLHERIHTGDRRKVCKVCGQAFVQKASLNYHMSKYHPEVKY